ncbi:MAG: phosphatase PAP2 family protein, partial [Candidatus Binataceae bacterium]
MKSILTALFLAAALYAPGAHAQTDANLASYRGLAPVTALENSPEGKAALAANLAATGGIQDGSAHQPTLMAFAEQQQQALKDAFITSKNARQLADALGTKLGAAYQARATGDANIAQSVAAFIGYAFSTSNSDSTGGKYFFAKLAMPDTKTPVSTEAAAILTKVNGKPDMFGRAYGLPAGSPGGDAHGNARPFQTEPHLLSFRGIDLTGAQSNSIAYLYGPAQDLRDSPSFPSGHTTYGYTESLLLGLLVPERYAQMVVRGAEYGNSRVMLGAHYTMDVLAGRTLALYDLAHLLANAKGYAGVDRNGVKIDDFRKALATARADATKALEAGCGAAIAACAKDDQSRFADPARNRAFYVSTQTYGLPVVFAGHAAPEDV